VAIERDGSGASIRLTERIELGARSRRESGERERKRSGGGQIHEARNGLHTSA